jgi:polysaccharide export outer membrane protein
MVVRRAWQMLVVVVFLTMFFIPGTCVRAQNAAAALEKEVSKPKLMADVAIGEATGVYSLGKGDMVNISVRNQPEFSGDFVVGPDGKIQYNFVGDIEAEKLSKNDLQTLIAQKLERFVKGAEVSVTITAYRSKFVYVLGEVHVPGQYPMKGDKVSLREAIVAAGLPTPFAALRRVYVITPDVTTPKARKVDLYRVLYQGILKDDVDLVPGDLVVVSSTIPSEINRALTNLLSPLSQGLNAATMYKVLTE